MYGDLHIHSSHSDGLLSLNEIITAAISAKIKVIAITDHDTLNGVLNLSKNKELQIIPGIELTVNNKLHILGYFIDPSNDLLKKALETIQLQKAVWLVKLLNLLGNTYNISISKVMKEYKEITLYSITEYLLCHCECKLSKKEIYQKYIWGDVETIGRMPTFSTSRAIKLIKEAGGIAVLAHPSLIWKTHSDFLKVLEGLIKEGLDGIEVYHISNAQANQIEYFKEIAQKYGLLVTGGSDFHGLKNKKTRLGEYGITFSEWNIIKKYGNNKGV